MEEAFKLRVSSAIPGATVFEIIGSKYELVPKDYGAVVIRDHRKVFLAPNSILRQLQRPGVTLRDYYSILLRDRKYGPPNALAALDYLRARGWAGKLIDDVDPQDPATASTIRQFLEQKYSISGVPVEITLVPTAISAFLGYLGFSLFGPFVRLRTCKGRIDDEAWIMTVVLPGYIGTMLMVTQTIFAVILFALPLAVMVDQHLVVAPLDGSSRLLWYFAAVGEILCSVSLAAFLLRLSRLRVALRSEAAGRANLDSEKDTPLAPIDQAAL